MFFKRKKIKKQWGGKGSVRQGYPIKLPARMEMLYNLRCPAWQLATYGYWAR